LERQIRAALFERVVLSPPKVAPVVREIHPEASPSSATATRWSSSDYPRHIPKRNCIVGSSTVFGSSLWK
jgi:hypothetical protein